jgi:hypothetical protein
VATTGLRPRLDELARLFPGSETYLHIHDSIGAAPAQLSAFASQTTRFDLAGYPAICVERGGKVLRGGRAVQSLPALIDDLNALLGGRAGGPRST